MARSLVKAGKGQARLENVAFLTCLATHVTAESFRSYYAPDPQLEMPALLKRVKKPTLVVVAGADQIVRDLDKLIAPLVDGKRLRMAVVPDADHFFRDLYGEERGVLRIRLPLAETLRHTRFRNPDALLAGLARERSILLQARQRRDQPARDEKILVGANGLAIEAFAASAAALRAPRHLKAASATAERIWRAAYDQETRRLAHQLLADRAEGEGFLEDYALLARGFLALHEATGEARWRTRAATLAQAMLEHFSRPDGRLASARDEADLFVSADEHEDYVHPSGQAAAVGVLRRLGEARFTSAANRALRSLAPRVAAWPESWPALAAVAPRGIPDEQRAPATTAGANTGIADPEWPTSANRIKAVAVARTGGAEDRLRVELAILPGWHLNANPASHPYLIPTEVAVEGASPLQVRYPKPVRFAPCFVPQAIDVYEGQVAIEADFPKGALSRRGVVAARLTVQACSDTVCLPPETIAVPVRADDQPALKRAISPPKAPGGKKP